MARLLKSIALGACVLVVLAVGLLVARRMLEPDYQVYDRERWVAEKSAKASENRRSLMVKDIKRRLHVGMTKLEVVDLLGQPDGTRGNVFSYELGMPGFGVDYEYFLIEFDAAERVTRWRVEQG